MFSHFLQESIINTLSIHKSFINEPLKRSAVHTAYRHTCSLICPCDSTLESTPPSSFSHDLPFFQAQELSKLGQHQAQPPRRPSTTMSPFWGDLETQKQLLPPSSDCPEQFTVNIHQSKLLQLHIYLFWHICYFMWVVSWQRNVLCSSLLLSLLWLSCYMLLQAPCQD